MSYGFLTESALVPKKGKAIAVTSSSLFDLSAIVAQKEKERFERGASGVEKRKSRDEDKRLPKRNKGVEERNKRDAEEVSTEARSSAQRLAEKVALYERLARGDSVEGASDLLVDFEGKSAEDRKRFSATVSTSPNSASPPIEDFSTGAG